MANRRIFIKKIGAGSLGLSLFSSLPYCSPAQKDQSVSVTEGSNPISIPRSSPEEQGISSDGIKRFLTAIEDSGEEFHSIMIIRHGHVVAEGWWDPYSPDLKQQLYSLSKSFTSTAIGLAVGEGLLTVEDPVISFFPDDLPDTISENLSALKVKHLLTMSVGHAKDSIRTIETTDSWAKTFLSIPIAFEPGTKFLYNSGASYMLAAIINKVTGQSAHDYLKPRLFEPLNITGSTWTENAEGVNMGASHLRVKTEDLGKFGQLYLQKGMWNGKQILSGEWIRAASKKQISTGNNDSSWGFGYGYQFWLNPPGGFRADGAFGQYSMIFPDQDAVVVITSESVDKAKTMQLVWDQLLPEMKDGVISGNNSDSFHQLQNKLGSLAYFPPKLNESSPEAAIISGKEYICEENIYKAKSVTFEFTEGKCVFTLKEDGKKDIQITCGINKWMTEDNYKPEANTLFSTLRIDFDSAVAASATWKEDNILLLTWRTIETTHSDTLTCAFRDDQVNISFLSSVAIIEHESKDSRPVLVARS